MTPLEKKIAAIDSKIQCAAEIDQGPTLAESEWLISELKAGLKRERVLRDACEHTHKFCLCDRNTKGFDYGESHRYMGKPKVGARWLTPDDVCSAALKETT
jgi:hypothetical protein